MNISVFTSKFRYILVFVVFLCSLHAVKATHIVGGELTYACLGNNRYEISLTVYRDCVNGVPPFDPIAYIGVFGSDNSLLQTVQIERRDTLKLNPVLNDSCLIIPPNVCVSTTTYKDTITLLPRAGGYVLAYQRCCRNRSILNIVKPLENGGTYIVEISELALQQCNSSAKFKSWPPIYICVNKPIDFDQSAIDVDGDSVFYKLCTPFTANDSVAQPKPSAPPPYGFVIWKPPYSLNNILGGVPLKIDPKTGLLTGIPNSIGQFVVGICIEEYRNGQLISTTRRDFQFNVGVCGQSVASIFAPSIVCDNSTVFFTNKSLNSNKYNWDFGLTNETYDTSSMKEPAFVYPDTGTYTIRLITQPGSVCADTSFHVVTLKDSGIAANFLWEELSCDDSLVIKITNKSTESLGRKIISYNWELFYNDTDTIRSREKDPVFNLKRSGVWTIRLTIVSDNGCEKTIERDISANLIEIDLPDTLRACIGKKVQLNPQGFTAVTYDWQPAADFPNPKLPKQEVVVTEEPKKYTVILSNGNCSKKEVIYVLKDISTPVISATAIPDTINFGSKSQLQATLLPVTYAYTWSPENTLNNSGISNPIAAPSVTTTYTVTVTNKLSQCSATAQARVVVILPVCAEPNIFLPNAFTPNDDGYNDVLKIRGIIVSEVKLLIYDRWGEKVFESAEINGSWDGTFQSKPCPPDVYGYYMEVICIDGQKFIKKGNITLIR
ncbi:MAG: gliding motility-associated C-terminal domain-containing protein [Saprospiraceae bacterium]